MLSTSARRNAATPANQCFAGGKCSFLRIRTPGTGVDTSEKRPKPIQYSKQVPQVRQDGLRRETRLQAESSALGLGQVDWALAVQDDPITLLRQGFLAQID